MKFQEYLVDKIAKSLGGQLLEIGERTAFALEVLAGIKTPEDKPQEELEIKQVEGNIEEAYQEEQRENRTSVQEIMEKNVSKSLWPEDNLTSDQLEALE